VEEVIGVGGISLKSPYVMQSLADVMGVPIKVAATQQAGALGAAMCAAVSAGVFHTMENARESLGQGYKTLYVPRAENRETYNALYKKYWQLNRFLEAR
jgi:L-ribulokinase